MKKNTLPFAKRVAVYDYLKEALDVVTNGCQYKDGGNDKAVAFRLDCTETNVRSIREECFGPLVRKKKQDLEEMISELVVRVEHLEKLAFSSAK